MQAILKNSEKVWDIVIIGGGASGLGTGADAASRGFDTLVLEKYDFSKGTSSRSTKLVHGGVRYLAQGDISLVMEALEERGLLKKNAPHLFKNQKFVIPTYDWWGAPFYTIGLKVYDMMAGKLDLGPSEYIDYNEIVQLIPNLVTEGLKGGVIYHDGQFDDSRLSINLAQTIWDNAGYTVNYTEVIELLKDDNGMIQGVRIKDCETGKDHDIMARVVINATGVFVDEVLQMDQPENPRTIVASQGVHVVLSSSFLSGEYAIMIPRTSDGRVLFAVPWHGKVVVGTTDTPVENLTIEPRALDEEVDFILSTAGKYLNKAPRRSDVLSVFAGLRPLAAPDRDSQETKELSRGHKIMLSLSGLITICGGKWTTYRKIGEDAIDKAIALGGLTPTPCASKDMPIHGFAKRPSKQSHLYVYGSDVPNIRRIIHDDPSLDEQIHPNLPYLKAEVVWAVRHEMARKVEDILARRLRALFLDARTSIEMAQPVAELMAPELGKDEKWIKQEVKEYRDLAKGYILEV